MKVSNKSKNTANKVKKEFKEEFKDRMKDFISIIKDKKFITSFVIIMILYILLQIYSTSVFDIQASKMDVKYEEQNLGAGNLKLTSKQIVDKISSYGYTREAVTDVMLSSILMVASMMPILYIPYFIVPFHATNMSLYFELYKAIGANMFLASTGLFLKFVVYAFAISFGGAIYRSERLKYKYMSAKSYNFYDFLASVHRIFGKEEKAVICEKKKKLKQEKYSSKQKKITIQSITIAVVIVVILAFLENVLLKLSVLSVL